MPVEQDYAGKQKADVRVLSSAAVSDVHYLRRHADNAVETQTGRGSRNTALALLSASSELERDEMTSPQQN